MPILPLGDAGDGSFFSSDQTDSSEEGPIPRQETAPTLTQVVTRTLVAAGYTPIGAYPHPHGVEFKCERNDVFGGVRKYQFVLRGESEPSVTNELRDQVEAEAREDLSNVVWVAATPPLAPFETPLETFLARLGGAVPTWRSLAPGYHVELSNAALNGERWRIFEELVADGLEFVFGRRVRHLGHRRPGERVPDIIAATPDNGVYVVDAKSASAGFSADWDSLRPLADYVELVRHRQTGQLAALNGALIVSSSFRQDHHHLLDLASQFGATHHVIPTFLEVDDLSAIVLALSDDVTLRSAIRWRVLLRGGKLDVAAFRRELAAVHRERVRQAD